MDDIRGWFDRWHERCRVFIWEFKRLGSRYWLSSAILFVGGTFLGDWATGVAKGYAKRWGFEVVEAILLSPLLLPAPVREVDDAGAEAGEVDPG